MRSVRDGKKLFNSSSYRSGEQLTYITTEEYTAENEDEITFPKNAVITVTQRSLDGWWQATYNGHTGLVPSSHLVPFREQPDIIQVGVCLSQMSLQFYMQ